jgi:hypothetical protein
MEKLLQCIQMPDMEVVAQKLVIVSQYANDFSGTCNYSWLRFLVCMAEPSWRIVSIQKGVMCLLCMVGRNVVALVVVVGLVAMVEVVLMDKVEEVVTGQILLMALMYHTRLKTLQMKNRGSLSIMVDGCLYVAQAQE